MRLFSATANKLFLALLAPLLGAPALQAQSLDSSGLKVSASVDMVGDFKASGESQADDSFIIREAEVILNAPIDPLFHGLLSLAAHREEGESLAAVHEAVISSSTLIPRSNIRLGQFFLGIGRLNRLHRHEWPIIFAPRVQKEFFGPEGALDSGLEYSYLAPLPFFLQATVGVGNGWTYGHSHDEGEKPKQPTHYARLASYFELGAGGGAETGLNFLSRTAASGERMTLMGLDFTAKWREASVLNVLLQGELWQRVMSPENAADERTLGAYLLPQLALSPVFFLGLLGDFYTIQSLKDARGQKVDNSYFALTPTLSYKASEFSTLRLAYQYAKSQQEGQVDEIDQRFQLQATFLIGAHPAHDF